MFLNLEKATFDWQPEEEKNKQNTKTDTMNNIQILMIVYGVIWNGNVLESDHGYSLFLYSGFYIFGFVNYIFQPSLFNLLSLW